MRASLPDALADLLFGTPSKGNEANAVETSATRISGCYCWKKHAMILRTGPVGTGSSRAPSLPR
eukprot:7468245-Prorocentrum_lima.AAC.1